MRKIVPVLTMLLSLVLLFSACEMSSQITNPNSQNQSENSGNDNSGENEGSNQSENANPCGNIEHTHTAGEWITDKDPTCAETGSKHQVCATCKETIATETIPASGHNFVNNICTVCKIEASNGLDFTSNGDGTCYVGGIGECADTEIIIPSKSPAGDLVTEIGSDAFATCTTITSVTIPNSVTSIGDYAFKYCKSLTRITIPNGVMRIGLGAFYYCTSLTSSIIPDSVTSIGDYAFYRCTFLTSMTISDNVTNIGARAFVSCISLTNVTIGNSVTSIGYEAFYYCTSLKNIYYQGTMDEWNEINKEDYWDKNTGDYTICCTDGEIAK